MSKEQTPQAHTTLKEAKKSDLSWAQWKIFSRLIIVTLEQAGAVANVDFEVIAERLYDPLLASAPQMRDDLDKFISGNAELREENEALKAKCSEIEAERNGDQEYLRKVMGNLEFIESENARLREALHQINDLNDNAEFNESDAKVIATAALKTQPVTTICKNGCTSPNDCNDNCTD